MNTSKVLPVLTLIVIFCSISTPEAYSGTIGQNLSEEFNAAHMQEHANGSASENSLLYQNNKTATRWEGKPWTVRLRASALAEVPSGDWFEGLEKGIGFEIAGEIILSPKASLRVSFSHCGLGTGEAFYIPPISGYSFGEPDIDFTIQKIMFWLVYYKQTPENITLFAAGGIGATKHIGDIIVPITDTVTLETENFPVTIDETKLTFGLGGGVVYWIADHVGIELGADLSVIRGTAEDIFGVEQTSYGYLLSPKAGITAAF